MNKTLQHTQQSEERLKEFISHYSAYLTGHKNEVEDGKGLLEMGAKTQLIQQLEGLCFNPMQALINVRQQTDVALQNMVVGLMKMFFSKAKEDNIVKSIYKKKSNTDLMFLIVLKDDSFETRALVFNFLSFYYTLDCANQVPVNFQFVPENLEDRFSKEEIIA